jgi:hypothetical protein
MTVHVRFFAAAAFAALTSATAPLAAQSVARLDVRDASPVLTAVGVVPLSLIDSATATASQPATASDASTPVDVRGPGVASARVAAHAIRSTAIAAPPVIQNKKSNKNSVALMIVGGAALVVGAVIGNDAGTLVMLGGAGIGLYGLYMFLT